MENFTRYLVFGFSQARGGWLDVVGSAGTLNLAKELTKPKLGHSGSTYQYQVVDMLTGEEVYSVYGGS